MRLQKKKKKEKKIKHNPIGLGQMFKSSWCQDLSSLPLHTINLISFVSYITTVQYLFALKTQGRKIHIKWKRSTCFDKRFVLGEMISCNYAIVYLTGS